MARILGDFNNDGIVDGRDSSSLYTYTERTRACMPIESEPTAEDVVAGDILVFGELKNYDARALLKLYSMDSTKDDWVSPRTAPSNWATAYTEFYYTDPQTHEKKPMSEMEQCPPYNPGESGYLGPYWIKGNFTDTGFAKGHDEEHGTYYDIKPFVSELP